MYPIFQENRVAGRESFPFLWILGENLLYLTSWGLATFLLWPVWRWSGFPVLAVLWLALLLVFQILLKKHICTGCYYYGKGCHLGWGKLAAALFKPDSGNFELGFKLTYFYMVTPPVILVTAGIYALMAHPGRTYVILLFLFVVVNGISFPVRKAGCSACVLREVCLGSAVKKKGPPVKK